jgi:hypothetical protein
VSHSRVVVVVPRRETALHEYLRQSLSALPDVEVVLDRRAASVSAGVERRRRPSESAERKILMCSLVHCPQTSPERLGSGGEPPTSTGHDEPRRLTLLWPASRLENVLGR